MKDKKKKKNKNSFISDRVVELIIVIAYLFILFLAWFDFYNINRGDELGFTILYFYLLLPSVTLLISIYIGKDKKLNNFKWLLVIVFGFLYMSPLFCLVLQNDFTIKKLFSNYYGMLFNGVIVSFIGMLCGTIIKKLKSK